VPKVRTRSVTNANNSSGVVVELDSESRLERLDAIRQLAGDVHNAIEQVAVGDVSEVDVDVDPKAGLGRKDLGPLLVAAGMDVELDLRHGAVNCRSGPTTPPGGPDR
jgi:hypothetical protein